MTRIGNDDATDPEELTRAEIDGRRQDAPPRELDPEAMRNRLRADGADVGD